MCAVENLIMFIISLPSHSTSTDCRLVWFNILTHFLPGDLKLLKVSLSYIKHRHNAATYLIELLCLHEDSENVDSWQASYNTSYYSYSVC